MVDPDGKVQHVHCRIYLVAEGKEKLLNPELDGFQKHSGKRKT